MRDPDDEASISGRRGQPKAKRDTAAKQHTGSLSNRSRAELGQAGEEAVAHHLINQGFVILERNARIGRLELDIVARRGRLVVFCEVRTRTTVRFGHPAETLTRKKRRSVRTAVAQWLRAHRLGSVRVRLDVAGVVMNQFGTRIDYFANAL